MRRFETVPSHRPSRIVGNCVTRTTAIGWLSILETLMDGVIDRGGEDVRVRWTDGAGAPPGAGPPEQEPYPTEQLLVEGACLGDDVALGALCRREWYGVFQLVSRSVGDPTEAEEVTQEVFARAIASLPRFRYVGVPFRSYLARITRNLLRDRWRAALAHPGMATEDEIPDRPAPEAEPEAIVLAAHERARLVAALGRLPRQCREVLYLRLLEGRTAAEIGVELGRTADSVRQIQHRALVALRAELVGGRTP